MADIIEIRTGEDFEIELNLFSDAAYASAYSTTNLDNYFIQAKRLGQNVFAFSNLAGELGSITEGATSITLSMSAANTAGLTPGKYRADLIVEDNTQKNYYSEAFSFWVINTCTDEPSAWAAP